VRAYKCVRERVCVRESMRACVRAWARVRESDGGAAGGVQDGRELGCGKGWGT
jgi:hypothetical protein